MKNSMDTSTQDSMFFVLYSLAKFAVKHSPTCTGYRGT